jgi:hypothetical protein
MVHAAIYELNMFYASQALTISSAESGSKMFIDGCALIDVSKKPLVSVGWNYGMMSTSDSTTSTTTLSTSDMGPRVVWVFDRQGAWSLGLTYNLIATASYSGGSGTDTWRGTTLKADIGWSPQLSEDTYLGIRLNYYSANYTEELAGGTSYSQVSYARSFIYPSVFLSYRM